MLTSLNVDFAALSKGLQRIAGDVSLEEISFAVKLGVIGESRERQALEMLGAKIGLNESSTKIALDDIQWRIAILAEASKFFERLEFLSHDAKTAS